MLKDNEKLYPDNLLLVARQSDADKIIADGFATHYEIVDVLNSSDVGELYQKQIARGENERKNRKFIEKKL